MFLHIGVIVEPQVIGERRFQSGITASDVQRVAVVDDIYEVAHIRLGSHSPVVYAQLTDFREGVSEVQRRREVCDGAVCLHIRSHVTLSEGCLLGL